jgi:AhpD family alkylhydroperoxidase
MGMGQDGREKIEAIIADRKKAHAFFQKSSETYRAFDALEEKTLQSGALEKGHKELIALAISIIVNCESCIEWHLREALGAGMTESQILEAIEVAIVMGGGPATVRARTALAALEYHRRA